MPSPQVSSKPVSAFVEPGPPPPPVPVLSSHVDLLSNATIVLCSRQDLLFFLTTPSPLHPGPAHRPTPAVVRATPHAPPARATTPHPAVRGASQPPSTVDEGEDDSMSDAGSSESSLTSLESLGNKIPKPDGEPGRPGRGGYNLEAQLAWDSTTFSKLKVRYALTMTVWCPSRRIPENCPPLDQTTS